MNDHDKKVLESYLSTLDRSLSRLSTSDRAEIITEIKGYAIDAMEREDSRSLENVLSALGDPQTVANKYLVERGMNPGQGTKTPVIKWLTIGFLGTGLMVTFVIALGFAFLFFDSDSDNKASFKFSSSSREFKSMRTISPQSQFKLIFNNAKIDIAKSDSDSLSWDCKGDDSTDPVITDEDGMLTLDLSSFKGAKCDISLPNVERFILQGLNGKIDYDNATVNSDITLSNGKINISLNEELEYEQDIKIGAGVVKGFPDSVIGGIKIKIDLGNGMVRAN